MRVEKDSLGEKQVPDVYYGIHTSRSLENFSISQEKLPLELIYAMVKLKKACTKANLKLKALGKKKADAISKACDMILDGIYDDEFLIDVFQSGSGTSSHVNVNEVIANVAAAIMGKEIGKKIVHPNDDVNKGQSTNNVFPSAIRIATYELSENLLRNTTKLISELRKKEKEFSHILKSGRTHLQDAVPITVGQEFGAWASALEKDRKRIQEARKKLLELGIGGNAVGTGVNTKKDFRQKIIEELRKITGEKYVKAQDGIAITQSLTDLAHFSAMLRLLSIDLIKITNDLMLLSSGPNTGLNELILPAVEPGSSIMPGKVNPSIPEAVRMAALQVQGYDHAISLACNQATLELNTTMPLVGTNLIGSVKLVSNAMESLAEKCIADIKVDKKQCENNVKASAGLATILNPILGYDQVADLVKESLKTRKTIQQLIFEKKIMSKKEFEKIMQNSTKPN